MGRCSDFGKHRPEAKTAIGALTELSGTRMLGRPRRKPSVRSAPLSFQPSPNYSRTEQGGSAGRC